MLYERVEKLRPKLVKTGSRKEAKDLPAVLRYKGARFTDTSLVEKFESLTQTDVSNFFLTTLESFLILPILVVIFSIV